MVVPPCPLPFISSLLTPHGYVNRYKLSSDTLTDY